VASGSAEAPSRFDTPQGTATGRASDAFVLVTAEAASAEGTAKEMLLLLLLLLPVPTADNAFLERCCRRRKSWSFAVTC